MVKSVIIDEMAYNQGERPAYQLPEGHLITVNVS